MYPGGYPGGFVKKLVTSNDFLIFPEGTTGEINFGSLRRMFNKNAKKRKKRKFFGTSRKSESILMKRDINSSP